MMQAEPLDRTRSPQNLESAVIPLVQLKTVKRLRPLMSSFKERSSFSVSPPAVPNCVAAFGVLLFYFVA